MILDHILSNKSKYLNSLLVVSSIYLWRKDYKIYLESNKQYEDYKLFLERHNCVIMYSRDKMTGWPPYMSIPMSLENTELLVEPFVYFINTAKRSIYMANMVVKVNAIINALIAASKRGLTVKMIVNFESMKNDREILGKMHKAGIKVLVYVSNKENLASIMHYKYTVKDFNEEEGYLFMGSANFSSTNSFQNNFEDIIFTDNLAAVEKFHQNFIDCWDQISKNNSDPYNQLTLRESGFYFN